MKPSLFDNTVFGDPEAAVEFIGNILESSTEYGRVHLMFAAERDHMVYRMVHGAKRSLGPAR